MGLFGLGWAEIGVIGVLALLFFGPDKLAPLAKDFGLCTPCPLCLLHAQALTAWLDRALHTGKSASGLKEVADSFAEGMAEGATGVSTDGGANAIKSAADTETVQSAEVKEGVKEDAGA